LWSADHSLRNADITHYRSEVGRKWEEVGEGMLEGKTRIGNENMKNYLPLNFNRRLLPVNALTKSPVCVIFSSHLVRTPFIANAFIHVSLEPFYPVT